jgi:RNA polymerase sigma-70 factor (ECF subfamily)
MKTQLESDLILRLSEGSHEAFSALYEKYKSPVYFFSLRFVRSKVLAEEMVHDVFLKIWESRSGLNSTLSFRMVE